MQVCVWLLIQVVVGEAGLCRPWGRGGDNRWQRFFTVLLSRPPAELMW